MESGDGPPDLGKRQPKRFRHLLSGAVALPKSEHVGVTRENRIDLDLAVVFLVRTTRPLAAT